jgi:hypothetical protein
MIDKAEFQTLADSIIKTIYADRKDQLIIYNQEGTEWIDDLYAGRPIQENNETIALKGGATVKEIIECLGIILSTFEMLKKGYSLFQSKKDNNEDLREMKKAWKDQLMENHVDEKIADKIVKEFLNDVRSLIKP